MDGFGITYLNEQEPVIDFSYKHEVDEKVWFAWYKGDNIFYLYCETIERIRFLSKIIIQNDKCSGEVRKVMLQKYITLYELEPDGLKTSLFTDDMLFKTEAEGQEHVDKLNKDKYGLKYARDYIKKMTELRNFTEKEFGR